MGISDNEPLNVCIDGIVHEGTRLGACCGIKGPGQTTKDLVDCMVCLADNGHTAEETRIFLNKLDQMFLDHLKNSIEFVK